MDYLADVYVRSVIFGALSFLAHRTIRNRSASAQHAAAIAALIAMSAIPIICFFLPKHMLPWLPAVPAHHPITSGITPSTIGPAVKGNRSASIVVVKGSFDIWILLWLAGVVAVCCRYAAGLLTLRKWIHRGTAIQGKAVTVRMASSSSVSVPMTVWLGRHFIVVPATWASWSLGRQESAIQHEMAHVQRGDWFTQMAAKLVCAVFWPNPFAWLLGRMARSLAERAADDRVIAAGVDPVRYAQDLLEIARETKATVLEMTEPSVCMARNIDVARRIEMILRPQTVRGTVSTATLIVTSLILVGLAIPVACLGLTRQSPAPAAGAKKVGEESKVKILVDITYVRPGVTMANSGLSIKVNSTRANSLTATSGTNIALYALSKKQAKDVLSTWHQSSAIVSAPKITTLSATDCSITTSSGSDNFDSTKVTPTYLGSGKMGVELTTTTKRPGTGETSYDLIYSIPEGTPALLVKSHSKSGLSEILGLITVSLVQPDRKRP